MSAGGAVALLFGGIYWLWRGGKAIWRRAGLAGQGGGAESLPVAEAAPQSPGRKWAGGAIGLAAVLAVAWLLWPSPKAGTQSHQPPSPVADAGLPAVQPQAGPDIGRDAGREVGPLACPCSENLKCTGPQGGIYCMTEGGNKRYLPRK
jgi:hypothetical protein